MESGTSATGTGQAGRIKGRLSLAQQHAIVIEIIAGRRAVAGLADFRVGKRLRSLGFQESLELLGRRDGDVTTSAAWDCPVAQRWEWMEQLRESHFRPSMRLKVRRCQAKKR